MLCCVTCNTRKGPSEIGAWLDRLSPERRVIAAAVIAGLPTYESQGTSPAVMPHSGADDRSASDIFGFPGPQHQSKEWLCSAISWDQFLVSRFCRLALAKNATF